MKLLLITSLCFNIVLAIFCWKTQKKLESKEELIAYKKDMAKIDDSPTSDANFRKIFIEKNDSLYRDIYNIAFENSTASAYLIACGYYHVTRNKRAKEDIDQTYNESKKYLK